MFSLRGFWSRHKKKILVGLGALGTGYAVYKLYDSYRLRILDLERIHEEERRAEEIVKAQLQDHFENIQRISDTTTLPYAMYSLRTRISEELDISYLTGKLVKAKGDPNILSPSEKFELWERVKILSFTRTAVSLWAMTMLCLYVRVQVNILGRHLYFETARVFGSLQSSEQEWTSDRQGEQKFLSSADYLSNYGITSLIAKMENAATKIMKDAAFREVMEISLTRVTDQLFEDLRLELGNPRLGIPLARLLPRVAQLSSLILEEPIRNKYVQVVRDLPEADLFFKLLYANSDR